MESLDRLHRGFEGSLAVVQLARVMHGEDDVLVEFAVHRKLASLAERPVTARKVALERLLTSMNVGVLLQVLRQRETLKTEYTYVLFYALVRSHVAPQREAGGVGLVAVGAFAEEWSFHRLRIVVLTIKL